MDKCSNMHSRVKLPSRIKISLHSNCCICLCTWCIHQSHTAAEYKLHSARDCFDFVSVFLESCALHVIVNQSLSDEMTYDLWRPPVDIKSPTYERATLHLEPAQWLIAPYTLGGGCNCYVEWVWVVIKSIDLHPPVPFQLFSKGINGFLNSSSSQWNLAHFY